MITNSRIVVFIILACYPTIGSAYIDPGTGSILIQGIIAAVAAVGVTLKLYWHRFVGAFKRKERLSESATSDTGDEAET